MSVETAVADCHGTAGVIGKELRELKNALISGTSLGFRGLSLLYTLAHAPIVHTHIYTRTLS